MKKIKELSMLEIELEERLTSNGLIMYAWDFYNSFEIIQKQAPREVEKFGVKYYLLCHSIELGMKAYLRKNKYSRKQLLELGHDLKRIFDEVCKQGIDIDIKNIKGIFTLNDYYKNKLFEYPQTGYKSLPSLVPMKNYIKQLLDIISSHIKQGVL